jgi:hypothetical protein
MRNIQVIDGADNCTYSIFSVSDDIIKLVFPEPSQNIEFNTDLIARISLDEANTLNLKLWENEINKEDVVGIHGTLFYDLEFKKVYYPTKRELEMVTGF